jgi:hypothetical protein
MIEDIDDEAKEYKRRLTAERRSSPQKSGFGMTNGGDLPVF